MGEGKELSKEKKEPEEREELSKEKEKELLSELSKRKEFSKELLALAKKAIEKAVKNKLTLSNFEPIQPEKISDELKRKAGVFVTLKKRGELRGCIGTFRQEELWKNVQSMAVASALHDPRVPPVSEDEIDELDIEISVIKNLREAKPEEIELGKHGVMIQKGGKGGVLLPQVAQEFGVKSVEDFLKLVCKKAGLPPDAWKEAKIWTFEVEKIESSSLSERN